MAFILINALVHVMTTVSSVWWESSWYIAKIGSCLLMALSSSCLSLGGRFGLALGLEVTSDAAAVAPVTTIAGTRITEQRIDLLLFKFQSMLFIL